MNIKYIDTRAYIIRIDIYIYILVVVRVCMYTAYIYIRIYSVYNGERNKSPFKRDDDDFELH
jgi:hypothetical protein